MISKNLRRIPKSAWCSNGPVAGFERNRWRKIDELSPCVMHFSASSKAAPACPDATSASGKAISRSPSSVIQCVNEAANRIDSLLPRYVDTVAEIHRQFDSTAVRAQLLRYRQQVICSCRDDREWV